MTFVAVALLSPWGTKGFSSVRNEGSVIPTKPFDTPRRRFPTRLSVGGEEHVVKILSNWNQPSIALRLKEYFELAGISATIVKAIDKDDAHRNVFYIALFVFMHEIPPGVRYVTYQLEQKQQSTWFDDAYRTTLEKSVYVFEYSVQNYQNMGAKLQEKMAYLPVPLTLATGEEFNRVEYDVLFYGQMCPRRSRILAELQSRHGIKVKVADITVGKELEELIRKTRIVVNLHYYDNALLETTRINEALRFNKIIVSEEPMAEDTYSRHLYEDVVVFTKNLDIYADRDVKELAATLKFYSNPGNYNDYIKKRKSALDALQEYCFGRFIKALMSLQAFSPTSFYQRLPPGNIHYLSLDESWQTRRESFLSQPHLPANVERIPAIKALPGWIGRGMSYAFAINSAKLSGLDQVTICEDDAQFSASFEHDYKIVLEYLSRLEKWDVFLVGQREDFDEDTTTILHVEEYRGLEFVTIDKFTSSVLTIFSASSFDEILSWNELNTSATENTFDRYLQSKNLTIVTTNPPSHLVRHVDYIADALWSPKGTLYPQTSAASAIAFSEKIEQFKARRGQSFTLCRHLCRRQRVRRFSAQKRGTLKKKQLFP